MAAILLPNGKQDFSTAAGLPLVGGKVYTFAAGTNTPLPTFADAGGLTPNANPVVLDARGEATIFWLGAYKIVLRDADDNLVWSVDNVTTIDPLVAVLDAYKAQLLGSSGSSLIGFIQAGDATLRTMQDKARERMSLPDYRKPVDSNDGPSLTRAYDELYATRTPKIFVDINGNGEYGMGHLAMGRGKLTLSAPVAPTEGAYGFSLQGEGQTTSVIETTNPTGHAFYYASWRDLRFADMGLRNTVVGDDSTVAFKLSGQGTAGHIASFDRVKIGGYYYGVKVEGTTNCDFGRATQIEAGTSVLFSNSANKNAISWVFDQMTVACPVAVFELGGAGIVEGRGGGINVNDAVVKYLEGAGTNGVHPQITAFSNMKWEYSGTFPDRQLLINAVDCALAPDSGGADTETNLNDVTWVLGDRPPGTTTDTSYDDHQIVYISNGRHRLNMRGGYVRGAIRYVSTYGEKTARWHLINMRAGPLGSRMTLDGSGSHPLIRIEGHENQADRLMGGESNIRPVGNLHSSVVWRQPNTGAVDKLLINSGIADTAFANDPTGAPYAGGTRYGANFTIDLTAAPLNLPTLITIEGLIAYIENNVNTTDTRFEWCTNSSFNALVAAGVTVAGGVRRKVQIAKQDLTVTDGKVYVRITKQNMGDTGTFGGLFIEYFRYFGMG